MDRQRGLGFLRGRGRRLVRLEEQPGEVELRMAVSGCRRLFEPESGRNRVASDAAAEDAHRSHVLHRAAEKGRRVVQERSSHGEQSGRRGEGGAEGVARLGALLGQGEDGESTEAAT